MPRNSARTLARTSIGLLTPALLLAAAATPMLTSTASADTPATPWSANAQSALLHVQALSGLPLADLVLGPAQASADSSKVAGASNARGANLDALALGSLSLSNILTDISQSSTPGSSAAPATGQLLAVPAAPLATAGAGTASAQTADVSNGSCPADGSPAADGISSVAGAQVLPGAPALGDVADVAQTVRSEGGISLATVAGQAGRSVTATATSSLSQLSLLGGSVVIAVAHPPVLTATATGTPGGGLVTYTAPVVTVTIAGQTQTLSAPGQDLAIPGLGDLSLGALTQSAAPDGTTSTGSASLLHLAVAPAGTPVASVDIAPETATATAPAGGVLCAASTGGPQVAPPTTAPTTPAAPAADNPVLEFHSALSATTVAPGQTFDAPLIVSNLSTHTVTDAIITEVVKGDATLVSSSPDATSPTPGTYRFGPITLAPGQLVTIPQTFRVPGDAQPGTKYSQTATATATSGGIPEQASDSFAGPTVGAGSGACSLQRSTFASDHREVTGGEAFDDIVSLFNTGAADCTNVVTTLTIPTGTTVASCTAGCTHTGNTVTWATGTLKGGSSRSLTVTLLAPSGAAQVGSALTAALKITSGKQTVDLGTALPRLTSASILLAATPATPGSAARIATAPAKASKPTQPEHTLAYTGAPPIALPALLLLLAAGVGTRVRRRRVG